MRKRLLFVFAFLLLFLVMGASSTLASSKQFKMTDQGKYVIMIGDRIEVNGVWAYAPALPRGMRGFVKPQIVVITTERKGTKVEINGSYNGIYITELKSEVTYGINDIRKNAEAYYQKPVYIKTVYLP